jgi:hypothetical protein
LGGTPLGNAQFVDFPSIYDAFLRGCDAESHSVAPDGNDGEAGVIIYDDFLTYFAREHKHVSSVSGKNRCEVRMASPLATLVHRLGRFCKEPLGV